MPHQTNGGGSTATPMPMTISQQLFEQFCNKNAIRCSYIPRDNDRKTPDYQIFFGAKLVVAEIKQLDPNPRDRQEMQERKKGKTGVTGSIPGARVRIKIREAGKQLRESSKQGTPTLLVLYDNVSRQMIDPYHIMTGMYGLEVVRLGVAKGTSEERRIIDKGFGPKRTCTPDHNTSISAVAVMSQHTRKELRLAIFHNVHARVRIEPELIQLEPVQHYTVDPDQRGALQEWREI